MALVQFEIFSRSLMRTVPVTAVLPADNVQLGPGQAAQPQPPYKTLYLLHGIFGSNNDWVTGTSIRRLAQQHNLAVIMPAGENHFYVNGPAAGFAFGDFIGQELVEVSRRLFRLSERREDTFIGGLSMGGYGALVNGLRHSGTFSHVAMLSPALRIDAMAQAQGNSPSLIDNRAYYEAVFGDLTKLPGSGMDYRALVEQALAGGTPLPRLYLAMGTEDGLLPAARAWRDYLAQKGVPMDYVESPGGHDWDFWGRTIRDVLDWLPLGAAANPVSSGNVGG